MRRRRGALFSSLAAVAILASGVTSAAASTTYTYVDLGVLGGSGCGSISAAWAVNNLRQVAGASTTNVCGAGHAFLWESGTLRDLGVIGGGTFAASAAYGINNAGDVVGQTHVSSSDPPHAFVFRNGVMTDLGTGFGAGSFSRAWDINNNGVVVGEHSRRQLSAVTAAIWQGGTIRDLGTLGGRAGRFGVGSVAHGVNDQGQVVGGALVRRGPLHPFLWENGVMRDLGTLGGNTEASEAWAINNAGRVVGESQTSAGETHAFMWQNNVMQDLGTLGGNYSGAFGINAAGQVVGGSRVPGAPDGNAGHAFLWTGGQMIDLNDVTTNLPAGTVLEVARAIGDDGSIVGFTCTSFCEPGSTAPTHGFLLIPN
jgi:probable HAF family extracellular repeat protein